MYAAAIYSPTANPAVYCRVDAPATGDTITPTARFHVTADNAVSYPIVVSHEISFVLDPPDFDDKPRIRPARKPRFQSPVREITDPWQAKWRLKQQRPRDGLRS